VLRKSAELHGQFFLLLFARSVHVRLHTPYKPFVQCLASFGLCSSIFARELSLLLSNYEFGRSSSMYTLSLRYLAMSKLFSFRSIKFFSLVRKCAPSLKFADRFMIDSLSWFVCFCHVVLLLVIKCTKRSPPPNRSFSEISVSSKFLKFFATAT
jgi:hypothetical protein